jgi:biotin operon repressor
MENEVPLSTKVLELLQNGKDNAMPLKQLVLRLQTNERKIRFAIEELRRDSYAVLITSHGGYFLAENKNELEEYTHYMKSRLINEYKTFKIVSRATKNKLGRLVQLPLNI